MSDSAIPMREHLEGLIKQERTLREQGDTAVSKALELQALEVERRMGILNHAHEKAIEVQETYVPREVYDNRIKEDDKARESASSEARSTAAGLALKVDEAKSSTTVALNAALASLNTRLEPLERMRYESAGSLAQRQETRTQANWTIGQVITVVMATIAIGAVVLETIFRAK